MTPSHKPPEPDGPAMVKKMFHVKLRMTPFLYGFLPTLAFAFGLGLV